MSTTHRHNNTSNNNTLRSPVPLREWSRFTEAVPSIAHTMEMLHTHVALPAYNTHTRNLSSEPESESDTTPPLLEHERNSAQLINFPGAPQLTHRAVQAANLEKAVGAVETGISEVQSAEERVRQGTVQLREACEALVRERAGLHSMSTSLKHGLGHFELLEVADAELRHGTVGSERFLGMLAAVDQAIAFLTVHGDFVEAHEYLQQYRHVQRRGLAALRDAAVEELQGLAGDDAGRGGSVSYVRFSAAAERVGRLVRELERRGAEGRVLVSDCLHRYVLERGPEVATAVAARVSDLLTAKAPLTMFVRAVAPQFLVQLARDEYALFERFFDTSGTVSGETAVAGFVEMVRGACEEVYGGVRTLVVHENDVDELCDAVEEVRGEAMERASEHSVLQRALVPVLHRIVADIQERLIFRASSAISVMRTFSMTSEGRAALSRFPTVLYRPPTVRSDAWYPPLERTLWLLGRLHRVLDRGVFEGLAPEAVHVCADVIMEARTLLGEGSVLEDPTSKSEDGEVAEPARSHESLVLMSDLFAVRHLVILREQTSPFNLATSPSTGKDASASSSPSFTSLLGALFSRSKHPSHSDAGVTTVSAIPLVDKHIQEVSQHLVDAAVNQVRSVLQNTSLSEHGGGDVIPQMVKDVLMDIQKKVDLFLGEMAVHDLLRRSIYHSIEDYLRVALADVSGGCGIDEFLMACGVVRVE